MRRWIPLAMAISLLVAPIAPIARADDPDLERVLIESANTPKEHAALATYYSAKAADARKRAEQHRAMGKAYGGAKITDIAAMKAHCEKLAAVYDEQAKEYEELARKQREMAK